MGERRYNNQDIPEIKTSKSPLDEMLSEQEKYEKAFAILKESKKMRKLTIILRISLAFFFVALIVVSIFTIKSSIIHFSSRLANGCALAVMIIALLFCSLLIRSIGELRKRIWIIILTQFILYIQFQGIIFLIYWLVLLIKG